MLCLTAITAPMWLIVAVQDWNLTILLIFKLISTSICLFFQTQTLLRNNATASFFSAQLAGTQWKVEDVISFLSKHSEDKRPHGTAFTWRDVFNETDQAIMSISRFMEVWTALFHTTFSFLSYSHTHPLYLIIHLPPTYILSHKTRQQPIISKIVQACHNQLDFTFFGRKARVKRAWITCCMDFVGFWGLMSNSAI